MNDNEYKNAIKNAMSEIKPDPYLKTRLEAKIDEGKSTAKRKSRLKPAVACALALAIVAGAGAYGINGSKNSEKVTTGAAAPSFSIVAYAKENDGKNDGKIYTLTDKSVTLSDYKIKLSKDSDGNYEVRSGSEFGFSVSGENIDSVSFSSEIGAFTYYDMQKQEQLIDEGKLYVYVPLTDEENELYHSEYEGNDQKFAQYILKNKDCSAYFGSKKVNTDDYAIQYCDRDGSENGRNELIFTDTSYYSELVLNSATGETLTAKTYNDDTQIQNVYYDASENSQTLLDNPDTKYEDLKTDTITVTVKYKNGGTALKKFTASFNKNGQMQFKAVK